MHAAIALQLRAGQFRVGDASVAPPAVLLSGGETTVTLSPLGAAAGAAAATASSCWRSPPHLDGAPGIAALACDTDGIDGTEDNAGAIVYPDTVARAAAQGVAINEALARQ